MWFLQEEMRKKKVMVSESKNRHRPTEMQDKDENSMQNANYAARQKWFIYYIILRRCIIYFKIMHVQKILCANRCVNSLSVKQKKYEKERREKAFSLKQS